MISEDLLAYWWRETPNFGDGMNPELIRRLFGVNVSWGSLADADLTASGSVIQWITPVVEQRTSPLTVWGSGFIFDQEPPPPGDAVRYAAVRGHRSADFAGLGRDHVVGDPGLLAALVCRPARGSDRIGVVPHLDHYEHPVLREVTRAAGADLIDVRDPPFEVIEQIRSCGVILSSSLHGLVVADGFGIANRWITMSPAPFGGTWKFSDYYSCFFEGTAPHACETPLTVDAATDVRAVARQARERHDRPGLERIRRAVYDAFPF